MASRALKENTKRIHDTEVRVVSDAEIAARAYEIWEKQGSRSGTEQQDWLQAEEELRRSPAATV